MCQKSAQRVRGKDHYAPKYRPFYVLGVLTPVRPGGLLRGGPVGADRVFATNFLGPKKLVAEATTPPSIGRFMCSVFWPRSGPAGCSAAALLRRVWFLPLTLQGLVFATNFLDPKKLVADTSNRPKPGHFICPTPRRHSLPVRRHGAPCKETTGHCH